jgi:hypothetical protein
MTTQNNENFLKMKPKNKLRQYLSNIQGKGEIKVLQTTAILCTAHRLREVLM